MDSLTTATHQRVERMHQELRNAFHALVMSGGAAIRAVVVDASGVSHMDLTGCEAISFMHGACLD